MSARSTRILVTAVLAGGLVLIAGCADSRAPASATEAEVAGGRTYVVEDLRVLSGPSPFAAGCPGALGDAEKVTGGEIEPAITANPADPRNVVGTWQQDFGFGARSDLVGWSVDGARTWSRSTIPGLTICTGGTADIASDPWLSAGVDGTIYFSATAGSLASAPPPVAVVTSRSSDGGRSWSTPVTVEALDQDNDTDTVTASPTLAGHAYVVWARWDHTYAFARPSSLRFARTADGGASWSPPVAIDEPAGAALDFSGHLLVVPDRDRRRGGGRGDRLPGPGTLVVAFARADFESGQGELRASRSRDEGRTWEPAVAIGSQPLQSFVDAESGQELPQAGFPSAAIAPDDTIYVAFEKNTLDELGRPIGAIGVARSRDGGRSWTMTSPAGAGAFAFHPAIAVASDGTVGLTFYDLRDDVAGDAILTTDGWFAHSSDGGASWQETHLAGPFDYRGAPSAFNGHALGEYQGLTALRGSRFGAILTLAAPLAVDGTTDVFFARIGRGPEGEDEEVADTR